MTQLIQKKFTNRKEISIQSNDLLIRDKSFNDDTEYKIKFDELGFDIVRKRISANGMTLFFSLFALLMFAGIINGMFDDTTPIHQIIGFASICLIFSLLALVAYTGNKAVIYLTGGQKSLELYANKPNEDTVNSFIESVHIAMRKYYKEKYSTFDANIPYEYRVNQLKWLKEISALTEEEYAELLNKSKTDKIIGFQG